MARPLSGKTGFKLTPAKIAEVADCFLLAFTDEQTATLCGIASKTIQRFRRGELCPDIKKAELKREAAYRRKVWDSRIIPAGICWMLERKYPQQFSKPEVQLGINLSTTNLTQITITAPQAEKVAKRIREVDAKVEAFLEKRKVAIGNGNGSPTKADYAP